jgi:hypothetical protein
MLIRITKGPGRGQVIDTVPAVARARLAGGTAELYKPHAAELHPSSAETAMAEPRQHRAVTDAQNPPPKQRRR